MGTVEMAPHKLGDTIGMAPHEQGDIIGAIGVAPHEKNELPRKSEDIYVVKDTVPAVNVLLHDEVETVFNADISTITNTLPVTHLPIDQMVAETTEATRSLAAFILDLLAHLMLVRVIFFGIIHLLAYVIAIFKSLDEKVEDDNTITFANPAIERLENVYFALNEAVKNNKMKVLGYPMKVENKISNLENGVEQNEKEEKNMEIVDQEKENSEKI